MLSETQTIKKIDELKKSLEQFEQDRREQKANKIIKCSNCNKTQKIKDTDLIDVQYYVEPYGCTGGDYWAHSEYNYICNKCNIRNRFMFSSKYWIKWDKRDKLNFEDYFFRGYKEQFKTTIREYPERKSIFDKREPFVNNYYVEQNIKRFITKEQYEDVLSRFDDQYVTKQVKIKYAINKR